MLKTRTAALLPIKVATHSGMAVVMKSGIHYHLAFHYLSLRDTAESPFLDMREGLVISETNHSNNSEDRLTAGCLYLTKDGSRI